MAKIAKRGKQIANNLGMRSGAGFLRNRGVSFEDALIIFNMPKRNWDENGNLLK